MLVDPVLVLSGNFTVIIVKDVSTEQGLHFLEIQIAILNMAVFTIISQKHCWTQVRRAQKVLGLFLH